MQPLVEVRTTFPDRLRAEACARRLLEEGLAACVQIDGPVTSVYRWQGRIECAEEWRCTCKTTPAAAPACAAALVADHPYDLPEVLVARVEGGDAYGRWVADGVTTMPAAVPPPPPPGVDGGMAFEAVIHALRPVPPGPVHADAWGTWPTLAAGGAGIPPFAISFDDALESIARMEGVYAEPDGSVVGVDPAARAWQFDAQLSDLGGRLLAVEIKGSCPTTVFDRLLSACGWPAAPVMAQLPRAGVFLDEATFRRHAAARWEAGDARTLRPG